MTCEEARAQIQLYVDHEMPATETMALEAHLVDCERCRAEYEALLSVVDAVRGTRPLYEAPKESVEKVEALLSSHRRGQQRRRVLLGSVALVVCLLGVLLVPRWWSRSAQFESFATDTHLRYARGLLPLDVASQQPQIVNRWLSGRLPFHLVLPDYPSTKGEAKPYSLAGARLVQFREDDVAFLAYRMNDRPISLLVAASSRIVPSGGEIYRSGNLAFHLSARRGLNLITWTDQGLSYALVSALEIGGAASCVVCHGTEADREKLELKSGARSR